MIQKNKFDDSNIYVNHEFSKFMSHNGIVHELTCMYTPQQNKVAKRKNCHIF